MTSPFSRAAAVAVVAAALLSSCGSDGDGGKASGGTPTTPAGSQLFPHDLEPVCSGAPQSWAAAHGTTETHKALYFETYKDDLLDQSSRLPSDWTVTFDANSDALAAVDVVGCGLRTAEKLAKDCPGYKDDDSDTE